MHHAVCVFFIASRCVSDNARMFPANRTSCWHTVSTGIMEHEMPSSHCYRVCTHPMATHSENIFGCTLDNEHRTQNWRGTGVGGLHPSCSKQHSRNSQFSFPGVGHTHVDTVHRILRGVLQEHIVVCSSRHYRTLYQASFMAIYFCTIRIMVLVCIAVHRTEVD